MKFIMNTCQNTSPDTTSTNLILPIQLKISLINCLAYFRDMQKTIYAFYMAQLHNNSKFLAIRL